MFLDLRVFGKILLFYTTISLLQQWSVMSSSVGGYFSSFVNLFMFWSSGILNYSKEVNRFKTLNIKDIERFMSIGFSAGTWPGRVLPTLSCQGLLWPQSSTNLERDMSNWNCQWLLLLFYKPKLLETVLLGCNILISCKFSFRNSICEDQD